MPNQMIALQAKGPKLPDPANQTAKFVNMMNMTKQQEVAERQSAQAAQQMAYATAEENRRKELFPSTLAKGESEAESAELDRNAKAAANLKTDLAVITTGDINAISAWRENAAKMLPAWGQYLPPAEKIAQDRNVQLTIAMTIQQIADKTIPTPTTNMEITGKTGPLPENTAVEVKLGGLDGPSITPIKVAGSPPPPPPAPAATPTAAAPAGQARTGKFGEALVVPDSARPLTADQQDHIRRMQEGLGMTNTPASFNSGGMGTPTAGQMSPDMVPAILDSAVNTGVMAQIDLDQMLALAPPQARQGIMDVIRSNNISLQADAPSLATSGMSQQPPMGANPVQTPQSQFADMRGPAPQSQTAGLRGAPPMEQTLAQYQSIQRRDPNVSPLPGSSLVAPQVLGSQKAAETAGSENVKVGTEPRIVAGTERAKRLEKLRGEMPVAKAETQTLVNSLTGRINAIDEYLRSGSRNSIIGAIEGRIPRALQSETRADAQGLYDYITSNTVLQKLIDDRGQTETGGSPQGVVSDADLKVAAQASTKLTQTGSERKQEIEMQRLRDELYRTREIAIQKYNNVYREVMKEAPELRLKVRTVAPKYKSAPQTPTRAKSLQNIFGG